MKVFEELLGGIDEATNVYRGTVNQEVVKEIKEAAQEFAAKFETLEKQMNEEKAKTWSRIVNDLNLEPGNKYFIVTLTGQVFERVPKEKLEKWPLD